MSADPQTIAYFDRMAQSYGDVYARSEPDADLQAFVAALPAEKGTILDWGCGVGNTAAILIALGYDVEAPDASPGMAQVARELGIEIRLEPFDALVPKPTYTGIWANFSLIHCPRAALPAMIARAAAALLPGGILHLGMEDGDEDGRDQEQLLICGCRDTEVDAWTRQAGLDRLSVRHGTGRKHSGEDLSFFLHLSRKKIA